MFRWLGFQAQGTEYWIWNRLHIPFPELSNDKKKKSQQQWNNFKPSKNTVPVSPSSWRHPAGDLAQQTAAPASPSGLARWAAGSWSGPHPVSGWSTSDVFLSCPVQWCGPCGSSPQSQTSAQGGESRGVQVRCCNIKREHRLFNPQRR